MVFSYGTVKEIMVILGSTPVTPKEVYRICFPLGFYEGRILTYKESTSMLFRKLVTSEFFTDLSSLRSCSKVFVMFLAPRDQPAVIANDSVVPKLNYKVPVRGSQMVMEFTCTAPVASAELSKIEESDVNLSGVEPLDAFYNLSLTDTPLVNSQGVTNRFRTPYSCGIKRNENVVKNLAETPSFHFLGTTNGMKTPYSSGKKDESIIWRSGAKKSSSVTRLSTTEMDDEGEFIWYQVGTTITGYKEKAPSKTESLFMM